MAEHTQSWAFPDERYGDEEGRVFRRLQELSYIDRAIRMAGSAKGSPMIDMTSQHHGAPICLLIAARG